MTQPRPRQVRETTAMLLIGDGILGLLQPSAHCAVWQVGANSWDTALEWFADRPRLVRACAALEIAAGLWLARRPLDGLTPEVADRAPSPPVAPALS